MILMVYMLDVIPVPLKELKVMQRSTTYPPVVLFIRLKPNKQYTLAMAIKTVIDVYTLFHLGTFL